MSNITWITKYKPKKKVDLIGNNKAIIRIIDWLKTFNTSNNQKANLLIIGPNNIGKTSIINVLLCELNYYIQLLCFNKINNKKEINDYINSLLKGSNILNLINNIKCNKSILVDNLETISSTIEQKSLNNLIDNNEKNRHLPIILISNNKYTKFLTSLKNKCLVINLYSLYRNDLLKLMNKIIKKEKINLNDEFIKNQIIDYIQGDIRKLINVLQDIYYSYKKIEINEDILEEYLSNSKKKEIDNDLFENTNFLLNKFDTINKSLTLYEMDKDLLPLMIHENYIDHINNQLTNSKKKLEIIKKVSDNLSYGDFIDYNIYNNQYWDMIEFHGFYTCVSTSFYINLYKKIKKYETLRFSNNLTKSSMKLNNIKNIDNIKQNFNNNTNVYDYIYINKIINHLIKNNKINDIKEKLCGYNLNISQIDSLLKISKLNTKISSKIKKMLIS